MKILMLTPEWVPYAKTGGLGDMVAALGKELSAAGHEVRAFLPYYGGIKPSADWVPWPEPVAVHLSPWQTAYCRVWTAPDARDKLQVHFLEYNVFFASEAIYGVGNTDAYRFGFQSLAALDFCLQSGWIPDVVHAHDWTAGLAPVILNTVRRHTALRHTASVFTVHNLQHQGLVPADLMRYLHLPAWLYTVDNLECYGALNMMKGALYHATQITTVSPTYAWEIQGPVHGFGLDHVLRHRAGDLTGILNGIDTRVWNPATDKLIAANYSNEKNIASGKAQNKTALQRTMQLPEETSTPVFGVVARLYEQKGLDWLADILPMLLAQARMQLVLLGNGDPWLEARFRTLARNYPRKCAVRIGFDNTLSHLVEAGSDFFLMPSRFEPCGLNQMYSMGYGTLPIVRATGGLADTVKDWSATPDDAPTGILFSDPAPGALLGAIHRALQLYFDSPDDFIRLRNNALRQDFSWTNSAGRYEKVYEVACQRVA
ncbi:MAG: glycogen synthase GlgA [Puniceicoccales bacterium]|nr:glycogen synthase GlgA [Puniceicoccales bacterium]